MNIYLGTYLVGCLINVIILLLIYVFDKEEFDKELNETVEELANEDYLDKNFVCKILLTIYIGLSWIILLTIIDSIFEEEEEE